MKYERYPYCVTRSEHEHFFAEDAVEKLRPLLREVVAIIAAAPKPTVDEDECSDGPVADELAQMFASNLLSEIRGRTSACPLCGG